MISIIHDDDCGGICPFFSMRVDTPYWAVGTRELRSQMTIIVCLSLNESTGEYENLR